MLQNKKALTENFHYEDGTLVHAQDFGQMGLIEEVDAEELDSTENTIQLILSFVTSDGGQRDKELTVNTRVPSHLGDVDYNHGVLTLTFVPKDSTENDSESLEGDVTENTDEYETDTESHDAEDEERDEE
jgi:hypothetical protein